MVAGKSQKAKVGDAKMMRVDVFAEVKGIKYKPFLCRKLDAFSFDDMDEALQ